MDRDDKENKKAEIVRLFKEAAKPARRRRKPSEPKVHVTGDGNITAGRDVNISPVIRPQVVVKTGDGTIDAAQKAELQRLVKEWVEARNAVRRGDFTYAAAWGAFKNAFHVNKYDELPMERFGDARTWFQRQLGILSGMKSAPKRMPNWRSRTIASIKARCKNQLGDPDVYRSYIMRRFGKESLTQLTDDELQQTKGYVWGLG